MDDMLAILFPHLYEDLEYLIPPEDGGSQDTGASRELDSSGMGASSRQTVVHENAIAGPSGLH